MKVLTPYRVLPAGSRRPASWKDESGAQIKQRTKEAAIQILLGFRKQIVDSANPEQTFIELASKESDCSSARDGGNLGFCPSLFSLLMCRTRPCCLHQKVTKMPMCR